ncbi:MAG: CpaD family pilus assembly protein [Parvularculaceae bacterium]
MTKSAYKTLLVAITASAAAACSSAFNGPQEALTVAEEHPISVDSQTITMTIDLADASTELSSIDRARLRAFADSYLRNGHGALSVTTPSGVGSDGAAKDAAGKIRQALFDQGVPWSAMQADAYAAGDRSRGDVILSYTHYVATPSACGVWEGIRQRDYANRRTPNFGCSSQNNLAAMVADPHDLIAPAEMTDPDSAFRIRGVQAFRAGTSPASETDSESDVRVAE